MEGMVGPQSYSPGLHDPRIEEAFGFLMAWAEREVFGVIGEEGEAVGGRGLQLWDPALALEDAFRDAVPAVAGYVGLEAFTLKVVVVDRSEVGVAQEVVVGASSSR